MLRRLLAAVVILALAVAIVFFVAYRMAHGTPTWYRRSNLTAAEQAAAANRADQKFADAVSWAADAQASETRRRLHASDSNDGDDLPVQKDISFTEDELNAFLGKWQMLETPTQRQQATGQLEDLRLLLQDHELILAGTLKEVKTIYSIRFVPSIEADGRLRLRIARVLLGELPLPPRMYTQNVQTLADNLRDRLPDWREKMALHPDGTTNGSGALTAVVQALVDALDGETSDSVMLIPSTAGEVPVRLTNVQIEDQTLTLTVQAMSLADRLAALEQLRNPPLPN